MIWRPNFNNTSGSSRHFLQLNMTAETLSFTDISGDTGIANRGLLQDDIFLGGLAYLQTINDSFDNSGQHFEPGVFNNVPATSNPLEPVTVVRMGSIPHGTTINMQGEAFTVPTPIIGPSSITPFRIGSVDDGATDLVPFPEEDLSVALDSRTDLARVAGLTQTHLANPNLFLTDALAGQTITNTVVITLTSDSLAPGAVPDAGGGIDNIAFLVGKGTPPTGGPNAVAPKVTCVFWIEEGFDSSGQPLLQLQYTQRVILDFGGLSWPHVTVATLRPI
ncbi:heme-binding protein [Sphingopyxis sp. PET50]|uniref:heme-binding protein n=1 Tax=Sphingopyxis sp. PET50 TaxID=2976533 RepID=UPI00391C97F5